MVPAQGRDQAVEVLDVDVDVFDEEDMALPVEFRRMAPVEEIDERGKVPADGDPRDAPRRGRGQPAPPLVDDLLAGEQGEDLP